MSTTAQIIIHSSQFPENVRKDLLQSLRTRRINHKFHYDSHKQAQKWLALHEKYSPARTDPDCRRIYEESFKAAAATIKARRVRVLGLGCGGGQKDFALLSILKKSGKKLAYLPCDVSVPLTLISRNRAAGLVSPKQCVPFVCDLASATDIEPHLSVNHPSVVTFFGMLPNFEPQKILPNIASLIRNNDLLLLSANLVGESDYDSGMKKILPQYDNPLTRDWLMTLFVDLGIEPTDGLLRFDVETLGRKPDLKRVVATFHFRTARQIRLDSEVIRFRKSEAIRLFFSYRYTASRLEHVLRNHGIELIAQWINRSGEEGVFLCRRRKRGKNWTPP